MLLFTTISLLSVHFLLVESSSCYNSKQEPICDERKCPKTLKCNVGKDECNCCKVCMKQKGEICIVNDHKTECDHGLYCIKTPESIYSKCDTLKNALIHETAKYITKMKECKKSDEYYEQRIYDLISCFLNVTVPTFYCKKSILYNDDDCCIHENGCHPNRELYDKIDSPINFSALIQKPIDEDKKT
ncbi:uncharacterized protein LOC136077938 isoform X2 [Hydra vulgaris]|uniref:Uncharacterized protein LOC136077938 isoform X2 n=1 Tax=Hydra vulgaris TaxID=6087 RepID=A0ABM4BHB5_HYDVU